jgi:hypothetical protein
MESYIKMKHIGIGWEGMNWIRLAQGGDQAVMNTVINLWVPWGCVNFLTNWAAIIGLPSQEGLCFMEIVTVSTSSAEPILPVHLDVTPLH